MTHSRPNSVSDGEVEPAAGQPPGPPQPGLEPGLIWQFGDGHGIRGDHGLPFRVDLGGPQRPEQQPRPADPHLRVSRIAAVLPFPRHIQANYRPD
jgi:hypothetical protein